MLVEASAFHSFGSSNVADKATVAAAAIDAG